MIYKGMIPHIQRLLLMLTGGLSPVACFVIGPIVCEGVTCGDNSIAKQDLILAVVISKILLTDTTLPIFDITGLSTGCILAFCV